MNDKEKEEEKKKKEEKEEDEKRQRNMMMGDMLNTGIPGGIDMDFTTPI